MSDECREHKYVTKSFEQLTDRLARTTVQSPSPEGAWTLLADAPADALVQLLGDDSDLRTFDHARFGEFDPVRPAYGLDPGSTRRLQQTTTRSGCTMWGAAGSVVRDYRCRT